MQTKKTWLIAIVGVAVVGAVAVALTMSGKYSKGYIGAITCEEGGKGCPVSGPTSGPVTGPVIKGSNPITRDLWVAYLTRGNSEMGKSNLTGCFSDTNGNKYEKNICFAASKGYIKGNADGTFNPSGYVLRAEGAKSIVEVFGIDLWKNPKGGTPGNWDPTNEPAIDNYDTTTWFYDYVNTLIKNKFPNTLNNCTGGTCGGDNIAFHPDMNLTEPVAKSWIQYAQGLKTKTPKPVTATASNLPKVSYINRTSMVRSIVQSLPGYNQKEVEKCKEVLFSDLKAGPEAQFICFAVKLGLIQGYKDGTFKPAATLTRAEGLKFVVTAFDLEIAGPVLGCTDIKYGSDWFSNYFEIAQSNAFPGIVTIDKVTADANCKPGDKLTTTDANSWIKQAKGQPKL